MPGRRQVLLAAGACLAVLAGLVGMLPPQVAPRAPAAATGPAIVNDAVNGQWRARPTAPVRTTVRAALTVSAAEVLHDVEVRFSRTGPARLRHRRAVDLGSLSSSRVVVVPVDVRHAGSGSVVASITGRNRLGQAVGDTETLSFAADAAHAVFSDRGPIQAQVALLNLHRAALGPVQYQQQLDAIEGGGATVRIVRATERSGAPVPAGTPGTTAVSGQIQYRASDGSLHPARNVLVQVWDQGTNAVLATVYANVQGQYSTTVPTFEPGTTTPNQIYVQALAEADVDVNGTPDGTPAFIVHAIDSSQAQFISSLDPADSSTPTVVVANGLPVQLDMTANNSAVNDTAFDVADALVTGMQFVEQLDACGCLSVPISYQSLSVEFPTAGGTEYEPSEHLLQIGQSNQFNWVIILHEFGHYVANTMGITQSPGLAVHKLGQNLSTQFDPPNKLFGMEVAWSEGFATFFALMAEDAENAPSLHIPGVLDGILQVSGYNVNYSTSDGTAFRNGTTVAVHSVGEDDELSVGRTLWQLYKGPTVALPATSIIAALEASQPSILSTAVPVLMHAAGAAGFNDLNDSDPTAVEHADDVACILTAQAVAPLLISPSPGTVVSSSAPPTFTWNPGGAGAAFPLDQFTVQFWSQNWDKKVFESPRQSGTTYTPSSADWRTIVNSTDASGNAVSSLNVTVDGASAADLSTGAPSTGPYKSCASSISLDRPAADLGGPTPVGGSRFGASVGLSHDGSTSVVGAPGDCQGYIGTDCQPSSVSFYSLDPDSDVWKTVAQFEPKDLGIPGCSGTSCPDAVVLGQSVALSGDGTTAAASVAVDTVDAGLNYGNTWSLDVVTFARENGTWVITGEPTDALGDTTPYEPGAGATPYEPVALDDVGDELLVSDPFQENTALEVGSTPSNLVDSAGDVYSFSSNGRGDPDGFIYISTIADPGQNEDPFGPVNCAFKGCSVWSETFGDAIALSGNGLTATVSDQGSYTQLDNPQVDTVDTVDLFTARVASGIRSWSTTPIALTGSDEATSYDQSGSAITCGGIPCLPEDFGAALALADDGSTAFVGDPSTGDGQGMVYAFTTAGGPGTVSYQQAAELTSTDPGEDGLGAALATSTTGSVLAAGAPDSDVDSVTHAGLVDLFGVGPGGWTDSTQNADLTADDAANYNLFGTSVAANGDGTLALVGSPGDVDYTAYPEGYDGEVYTLPAMTPTSVGLGAPSLLALSGGAAEGNAGQSTLLTATVSPEPGGGTVSFTGPSGPITGCAAVPVDPASGEADCPVTLPTALTGDPSTGVDSPITYSATFSGSGALAASPPGTLAVSVVNPLVITTTTLPVITAGAPVSGVGLSATGGTGTLLWSVVTDSTDNLPDSMQLDPGGTFSGTIAVPGTYTFTVAVTDQSPVTQAATQTLTWVVVSPPPTGPPVPTVTLDSIGSTTFGSAARASVVVSAPGGNPPAGDLVTVSAYLGTSVAGTCTAILPGGAHDAASCQLPASLAAGTYSVVATFDGAGSGVAGADPGFATASSTPQTLLVDPVPTTTTISQLTAVDAGSPASVTVTVAATQGTAVPPAVDQVTILATEVGQSTPAATCIAPLSGGGTDSGTCSLGTALGVGTYSLSATFAGDANFITSTATASLTVVQGTTTAVTSPPSGATLIAGSAVTYSATVSAPGGSGPPTGTVSFAAGSTLLCSTAPAAGVASCTSALAPTGAETVTASFESTSGFGPSSGTTTVTVNIATPPPPPGATQSASGTGTGYFSPATASIPGLSATGLGVGSLTVATYGGTNPTGTAVTGGTGVFYDVAAGAGSNFNPLTIVACDLGAGANALAWWNGAIWQPFSTVVVDSGAQAGCVTATVDPESTTGGTSPTLQELTGTPIAAFDAASGDFSVNISPSSQNLGESGSVGYTVTVGSTGGFAEPVALSVNGLPSGVTGSFSPTTVNPEGASATSILTLTSGPTLSSSGGSFTVTGTYGSGSGAVVHSANNGSVTLNFELQPTCDGAISGTVTDAGSDQPVAGALVTAPGPSGPVTAQTAADGSYTVAPVELGPNNGTTTTSVSITAPGYFDLRSGSVVVSCGLTSLYDAAMTAIETSSLTGGVYVGVPNPTSPNLAPIPTATPLSGARITLEEYQANSGTDSPAGAQSAADGSYGISGIPLGQDNAAIEDELSVDGPATNPPDAPLGYWPATAEPTFTAGGSTLLNVGLVPVCGGGTITATVYSQDTGLPLADATVSDGLSRITTGADGVATFTDLEQSNNNGPRTYGFTAVNQAGTGQSAGPVETTLEACGDSASVSLYVHVPVNNYGNVSGTVTDSVTGDPVSGATVSSSCAGDSTLSQPNSAGVFTDDQILVGQDSQTSILCSYYASAPGYYYSNQVTTEVDEGLTSTVALTLLPMASATISGTVTDALSGQPISGVTVEGGSGAVTNASGQYSVSGNSLLGPDNAPQSDVLQFLTPDSLYNSASASVTATAGQTATLNVQLSRACGPATVSGTVYNASNQEPIPGAQVEASEGETVVTGSDGSYHLQIPTQNQTFESYLTASAAGFNPKTESIEIYCGAHIVLNFGQNSSETGTLTGTVTNAATSAPVPGAFVGTSWGATTTTNGSGVYTFDNVPLGNDNAPETWTVTVDPPAGASLEPEIQSVSVPGNATTSLNFALGDTAPPLPVAADQSYQTPANTTLSVNGMTGLLVGDQGTDISVTNFENETTHGAGVDVQPDGSFTFIPAHGFEGLDTFTYTITDAYGVQALGTVTVQVGPEAVPPTDTSYRESVAAGTTLVVSPADGLGSQATGTGLTFAAESQPQHGTLVLDPDGSYTYTPATGFYGTDYFFYTLTDAAGETVTDPVTITVVPPPAPTAADQSETTPFDTPLTVAAPGIFSGATGTGLSYGGVIGPSDGHLVVNPDGGYTYTPNPGFSGTDSFNFFVEDSYQRFANAVVTITVSPPVPPTAATYQETVAEGVPLAVDAAHGLLSADSGPSLQVTANSDPAEGTVIVEPDGAYTYTPTIGYVGPDSFTYTVTDDQGLTATGTVDLTVTPPRPTAPDYTETTSYRTALVVPATDGVLSQASGDDLTAAMASGPAHGTVTVGAGGNYTYVPYATYSGPDAFAYRVTDAFGQTATGAVDITVGPKSSAPPTAGDYTVTTPAGTGLTVASAEGLLSAASGDGISVTGTSTPGHGTVSADPDGSYTYTPDPGFTGTDTFTYTVTDVDGRTATGTVTVDVTAPAPPAAPEYTETTAFNTPLVVGAAEGVLSGATGTGLSLTGDSPPGHGMLSLDLGTGAYTYTPDSGFHGTDSFTYTVTDEVGQTATGTVSVQVSPPGAPAAPDYTETTAFNTPLVVGAAEGVLSGATGTGLSLTGDSPPAHGTLSLDLGTGAYTYTPDSDFHGTDSFTYTVTDAASQAATGTVSVMVQLPPPPTASNYSESTAAGTTLDVGPPGGLGSRDTGVGLTYALGAAPAHGTAVVNADGSYTYQPDEGYSGTDSFTYIATDAAGQTATGTVTITVAVAPPVVTTVSPDTGPAAGGTAISVTGTGFTGATAVLFGGVTVTLARSAPAEHWGSALFTIVSPTLITLVDPPGSGSVNVRVTTPAGTSAVTPADVFTYAAPPPPTTTTTTTTTTAPPTTTTTSSAPAAPTTSSTTGPTLAAPVTTSTSGGLAFTGFDALVSSFAGVALLALGTMLATVTRRRRRVRALSHPVAGGPDREG